MLIATVAKGIKKRHLHADLIHQWAEGAEIEILTPNGEWISCDDVYPRWSETRIYRIKPELGK